MLRQGNTFGDMLYYGAPAIAIAIDLRASISVAKSNKWMLNGYEFDLMKISFGPLNL